MRYLGSIERWNWTRIMPEHTHGALVPPRIYGRRSQVKNISEEICAPLNWHCRSIPPIAKRIELRAPSTRFSVNSKAQSTIYEGQRHAVLDRLVHTAHRLKIEGKSLRDPDNKTSKRGKIDT